ncbi:MFS transporter [Acetobacteraceae bacterium H6797]|nr:MFS transporter [Acetobacteraceae bacterium H6797]
MSTQTHFSKSPDGMVSLVAGIHLADQLCLAALPLLGGMALGLGPKGIAALVAAQGAAWLVASLPAGLAADRFPRRRLLRLAPLLAGLALAMAWLLRGQALPLGLASFIAGCAVVVTVLTAFAALPSLVPRAGLQKANARLELARAIATLSAAPLAGWLAERGMPGVALLLAALAACCAALAARRLPPLPAPEGQRQKPIAALVEGGAFVLRQPVLRAIAACAVLWNIAFFALAAMVVPLALGPLGLSPRLLGLALAGYGAGLLLGAVAAPWLATRVAAPWLLIAGPALSLLGALLLWPATSLPPSQAMLALTLTQLSLGFGPMIWQVMQTSLRQAVAPGHLLGRVGAVMQVTVFGVRPLGALGAGMLAGATGPDQAIWLPIAGFALSLLVLLLMLPRAAVRAALAVQ